MYIEKKYIIALEHKKTKVSLMHDKINTDYITLLCHFSNTRIMNQKLANTSCQKSSEERATFHTLTTGRETKSSVLTEGNLAISNKSTYAFIL